MQDTVGGRVMKHYFKLGGDIIVDAIQYPHEGYIEVELPDVILPAGINGGWYRWNGTNYLLDEELKRQADERDREAIIQQYSSLFEEERRRAREELLAELEYSGVIQQSDIMTLKGGVK
jgi:hypothetical protein